MLHYTISLVWLLLLQNESERLVVNENERINRMRRKQKANETLNAIPMPCMPCIHHIHTYTDKQSTIAVLNPFHSILLQSLSFNPSIKQSSNKHKGTEAR